MLQTQSVYPATLELLKKIMATESLSQFNLVGGTALALYYGHRISVDLDLFSFESFDSEKIKRTLEDLAHEQNVSVEWNVIEENTLAGYLDSIKVDLIRYRYPLLETINEWEGIRLISINDISAMKLSACAQRGSKKDFFDLYELLQDHKFEQLLESFRAKYPKTDTAHIIRSLVYFEDAESELDPLMIKEYDWNVVKSRIKDVVNDYIENQV